MKKKVVSRKYLERITGDYVNAIANSLPDTFEEEHKFSDEFYRKAEFAFKKYKRYETIKNIKKTVVAIFTAAIIGAGSLLSFNTDVRAAVFDWIRQIYENSVVYKYFGDKQTDVLPRYELQNLPEEFVLIEETESDKKHNYFYLNSVTGDAIFFEYIFIDDTSIVTVQKSTPNDKSEKISLNGYDAELYYATGNSKATSLIWLDNENGILFRIDTTMDHQVILDIFENIVLVN